MCQTLLLCGSGGVDVLLRYSEASDSAWFRQLTLSVGLNARQGTRPPPPPCASATVRLQRLGLRLHAIDVLPFNFALRRSRANTNVPDPDSTVSTADVSTLHQFAADDCILLLEVSNTSSSPVRLSFGCSRGTPSPSAAAAAAAVRAVTPRYVARANGAADVGAGDAVQSAACTVPAAASLVRWRGRRCASCRGPQPQLRRVRAVSGVADVEPSAELEVL